jgi:flagellar basal body-associated protein FliL
MENNNLNDVDDFDSGIELDKIEVPKIDAKPVSKTPDETSDSEENGETEFVLETEDESKKGLNFKVVIAVSAIILGTAVYFLSQQKHIEWTSFSKQEPNSVDTVVEYHAIDPIITNLGADKHIKIYLMIKNHNNLNNQISVTEPIIRDRILMFLTSQGTQRVINESDLEKVKSYINDELTYMLQSDYKNEVILKNLMVY